MKTSVVLASCALLLGCSGEQRKEMPARDSKPAPPVAIDSPPVQSTEQRLFPLKSLATIEIGTPRGKLKAWVMDDNAKRQEGMMWLTREDVPQGTGMIFVFNEQAERSFWMANTLIALDIVYLDSKGRVLNVVTGEPESEQSLPSEGESQYVIEVAKGEAQRLGIRKGSRLRLPGGLIAAE